MSLGCYAVRGERATIDDDTGADAAPDAERVPDASADCGADRPCPTWCEAGTWGGGEWSFEPLSAPGTQGLLVDGRGHAHVISTNGREVIHASNSSGAWTEDRLPVRGDVVYAAAALRGRDSVTVVALREPPPERAGLAVLYWATVESGSAEGEAILEVDEAMFGLGVAVAMDAHGEPHVVATSYVPGLAEDRLHSGRLSGGEWTWTSVGLGLTPNPGTLAIAIDSAGSTHVVYYAGGPAALVHWTERDGDWNVSSVDTDVNDVTWTAKPAIWIGSDDEVRLAYTKRTETWLASVGPENDTVAIGSPQDAVLEHAALLFDPSGVLHEAALVRDLDVVGDAMLYARWEGGWTTWGYPASYSDGAPPLLAFGPACCDDPMLRPYVGYDDGDRFQFGTSPCLQ